MRRAPWVAVPSTLLRKPPSTEPWTTCPVCATSWAAWADVPAINLARDNSPDKDSNQDKGSSNPARWHVTDNQDNPGNKANRAAKTAAQRGPEVRGAIAITPTELSPRTTATPAAKVAPRRLGKAPTRPTRSAISNRD